MKFEPNHKRKSHRLTIPISAIIDHHTYAVLDWSTTGLRVACAQKDIQKDDELELSLLLPTSDAAIILKVKAVVRNIYDDSCGMEIIAISDKNRRVLRHYATLAIEGNLDHIDDVSSNLFMTDVQTPIKEPVLLTDKEDREVHTLFLKKVFYFLLLALVFVLLVLFTFLHHYLVIENSNGIVTGNRQVYQAPFDGQIKKLYIAQDQKVESGQLLFEMDTKNDKVLLAYHQKRQHVLEEHLKENRNMLGALQKNLANKNSKLKGITEKRKAYLESQYTIENRSFEKAKYLYRQQLITYIQYKEIEREYVAFMKEYHYAKEGKDTDREKLIAQQEALKIKDQILSTQKMIRSIDENIQKNTLAILQLKQKIARAMVFSTERGVIHTINHERGEVVKFTDDIVVMETQKKPYILTAISTRKAASLYRGEACLLYYSKLDVTFNGKIAAFGSAEFAQMIGTAKDEVVVKIEVETNDIDLKLDEYVKVYFLNDSQTARTLLTLLPQKIVVK